MRTAKGEPAGAASLGSSTGRRGLGKLNKESSNQFKPPMLLREPGGDGQNTNIFARRLWELAWQGGENEPITKRNVNLDGRPWVWGRVFCGWCQFQRERLNIRAAFRRQHGAWGTNAGLGTHWDKGSGGLSLLGSRTCMAVQGGGVR